MVATKSYKLLKNFGTYKKGDSIKCHITTALALEAHKVIKVTLDEVPKAKDVKPKAKAKTKPKAKAGK